jgi:hypothetical protein
MGQPWESGGIWPRFQYVEHAHDTVLHVIALKYHSVVDSPKTLCYFRRVGPGTDTLRAWDFPPYIVDTCYVLGHDIAAADDRVALVWIANRPCPGDMCDSCSGYGCHQFPLRDNDIYYQISTDMGATFQPRANLTKNVDGEDGYRPYTDLSALMDSKKDLHIVWNARVWPADANQGGQAGLLRGRMFHWSEDVPYIRTVHRFEWDQTICNGGAWQLNAAKMSVSECDGKLFVLFVQYNDYLMGIMDDCADSAYPGFPVGAANGELYLSISNDWGMTWDRARNLTYSYSPHCDSLGGVAGPCYNENWPSMSRFGTNHTGDFSGVPVVVPDGAIDPQVWYLDVQYVLDWMPGGAVYGEGLWGEADVRWFRLPCVEPLLQPQLVLSPAAIGPPTMTQPGVQLDTSLIVENPGNAILNYNLVVEEDTGPSGWLSASTFMGSVAPGLNDTDSISVYLNHLGVATQAATLTGRLIFVSNAPTSPDTVLVELRIGCCNGDGMRGNVDDLVGPAGEVDVADLTFLVAYLFQAGSVPPCTDEGNVDGLDGPAGPIDVADLTYLVTYLFQGGPAPPACP